VTVTTAVSLAETEEVELAIAGMTCAACAVRVEKKLNRLDSVTASVNFATATARVRGPAGLPVEELIGAVERPGTPRPSRSASSRTRRRPAASAARVTPRTSPRSGGG